MADDQEYSPRLPPDASPILQNQQHQQYQQQQQSPLPPPPPPPPPKQYPSPHSPRSPTSPPQQQQQQQQQHQPALPPTPRVQPFQEPFIASAQMQPQQPEPVRPARSRATSTARPILHQPQPQPIREAVDKAFDQSTPITQQLDPAFIAQVTEAVVKNLQSVNLTQATPAPPQHQPLTQFPPPPPPHTGSRSPTQSSTASIPPRYTPSPARERERHDISSNGSGSPIPMSSDEESNLSRSSTMSRRDDDTPRPTTNETHGVKQTHSSIGRPRENSAQEDGPYRRKDSRIDSNSIPVERFPLRRDSQDSMSSSGYHEGSRSRARPTRVPSAVEELTSLEKAWQPLFDNGNPTMRLSQFLRGLAIHLIEDFEPKGSLVVTPAKMAQFFDETRIENEHYPWQTIFGGKLTCGSISVMFRRLLCQHHLVQVYNHEVPNVPGLTPAGFEWFMTCLIQAHPDMEYKRLALAVKNMPISNADNKSERFPKELSRRLFPSQPNPQAEQRLIASLAHEPHLIQLRNLTAMPPPPPSVPPSQNAFPERERKPYSHASVSSAIDDEDLSLPSVPIERERKPYTAREGVGKVYESDDGDRPGTYQFRPDTNGGSSKQTRPGSSQPPQGSYQNNPPSDPRAIPPPNRHRMSMGHMMAPPPGSIPNGNHSRSSGRRSPPPGTPFARSEPINVGEIPPAQYTSNMHGHPSFSNEMDEDNSRRQQGRRMTTSNNVPGSFDDDLIARGKSIPPRNIPSQSGPGGFDQGYGPPAGPPPPVGSYGTRPRPIPNNNDDRRRTVYGGGSNVGPGGSDGWGSFANGGHPPPQQPYGGAVQH